MLKKIITSVFALSLVGSAVGCVVKTGPAARHSGPRNAAVCGDGNHWDPSIKACRANPNGANRP